MPFSWVPEKVLRDAILAPYNRNRRLKEGLQPILIRVLDERVPAKEGEPSATKRDVIVKHIFRLASEGNSSALNIIYEQARAAKEARSAEAYAEWMIEPNILKAAEKARDGKPE